MNRRSGLLSSLSTYEFGALLKLETAARQFLIENDTMPSHLSWKPTAANRLCDCIDTLDALDRLDNAADQRGYVVTETPQQADWLRAVLDADIFVICGDSGADGLALSLLRARRKPVAVVLDRAHAALSDVEWRIRHSADGIAHCVIGKFDDAGVIVPAFFKGLKA